MKKTARRSGIATLVVGIALAIAPATAHAGTNIVPGGDGTGGGTWRCFQLTYWSPVTCIRIW